MKKKYHIVSGGGALLAIAIALVLTGQLSAGEDEAKAEKAIKILGGRVSRSPSALEGPIISVALSNTKVSDAVLKE